jgi:outer membrane protein TolC
MSKHKILRTFTTGILLTTGAFAQMSSFPKPSYFREAFKKADIKVELQPPVRLNDFVKSGQLELSLRDYLGLVMANNTSIQVQFLSIERARNAITSVYGRWDPTGSASFTPQLAISDAKPNTPVTDPGYDPTHSRVWPVSFGFNELLQTGQTISASGNGSKSARDGSYPSFAAGLSVAVTQPLLQNRGAYVNRIPLMQAQSSYKVTGFNLTSTLLSLINNAENTYWNAIFARENVLVSQTARDAAQFNWDFVQKQFSLGAISYLDTYNPQQQLAASDLALSQAKFNLTTAEDAIRQQISVDLDPAIRVLPLHLTESVELPESEAIIPDKEQEVQKALDLQPALKSAVQNLDIDDLSLASARNGLLPSLNLRLGYNGAGNGGYYTPGFGSAYTGAPISGGLGDALGQMFGWGNPTYSASLTLNLPIRSRTASMIMANALIQKRNDAFNVRNTQQNIRLGVLNAVTNLQGAEESLKLAKIQDDFSNKNLDAMHTKYSLGTETQQNVVSAQQFLAAADLGVLNAKISLQKAVLNLYLQTGELLDRRGIVVKTP